MCGLDPAFLSTGRGGGVIQGSASEAVLVAIIAARERVLGPIRQSGNDNEVATVASRLVAYGSTQVRIAFNHRIHDSDAKFIAVRL
jgi:aromatic-L-amino-acid/L-tryptophan decarboxylase